MVQIAFRYIVRDVDAAVDFYRDRLGFQLDMRPAPGFAALSLDGARLYLNAPGAGGAGAKAADGRSPAPGGWNRIQLVVDDLEEKVARLQRDGQAFRTEIIHGAGGDQILLEDPSGNPVELFQPRAKPH